MLSPLRPDLCHKDDEYDAWDAVADYIFQVIPSSALPMGNSTLSMEELQFRVRIDAPL